MDIVKLHKSNESFFLNPFFVFSFSTPFPLRRKKDLKEGVVWLFSIPSVNSKWNLIEQFACSRNFQAWLCIMYKVHVLHKNMRQKWLGCVKHTQDGSGLVWWFRQPPIDNSLSYLLRYCRHLSKLNGIGVDVKFYRAKLPICLFLVSF